MYYNNRKNFNTFKNFTEKQKPISIERKGSLCLCIRGSNAPYAHFWVCLCYSHLFKNDAINDFLITSLRFLSLNSSTPS